jgi:hypothetical protein
MTGEARFLVCLSAADLALVIALLVLWPWGLLPLAAGTIVLVALIGEGAWRLSLRQSGQFTPTTYRCCWPPCLGLGC